MCVGGTGRCAGRVDAGLNATCEGGTPAQICIGGLGVCRVAAATDASCEGGQRLCSCNQLDADNTCVEYICSCACPQGSTSCRGVCNSPIEAACGGIGYTDVLECTGGISTCAGGLGTCDGGSGICC